MPIPLSICAHHPGDHDASGRRERRFGVALSKPSVSTRAATASGRVERLDSLLGTEEARTSSQRLA